MKWCNNCEIECDDLQEACPKCGASLSDVDKVSHVHEDLIDSDYEVLVHIYDNVEADVLISYLNANGIETYVHYEGNGPYRTLLIEPGAEGTVIMVPAEKLEEAKVMMSEFEYVHEPLRDE